MKKIRYAVVGLGYIAQVAVLPAFRNATRNSTLTALVSGDAAKRRRLGRRYGVEVLIDYDGFADLVRSGEIDAVYIALPNSMHLAYTLAAVEAGVHVLCEKPLGVTTRECEKMVTAARRNDVRLMTAYRLHFERANLAALDLVRSGRLGDPRFFSGSFSMQVKAGNIRLKSRLGGGPLSDLGIYCLNAARAIYGTEPEEVSAFTARSDDARFAQVEEMITAVLRFPGDRLASFTASFGAADTSRYEVVGTRGTLRVDPAFKVAGSLEHHVTIGGRTTRRTYPRRDQFAPQLLHFSDCVAKGRDPEPSGQEGLADLRVIEALYRSAASGRSVRLRTMRRPRRVTSSQGIRRPSVRRPKLVRAKAPRRTD